MVVDEKVLAAQNEGTSDETKSHIRIWQHSIDRLNAAPQMTEGAVLQ